MIKTFSDLEVYQLSKNLYSKLVLESRKFPAEARYLVSQMSRAANSIHANIAEGYGRSEAEFKKFLTTALGSNNELISHLEDAKSGGYLNKQTHDEFLIGYTMIGKKLYRLRQKWHKITSPL